MNFDLITKHITPRFVIDVGARLGDWSKEAKQHWPNANFFLVEANEECEPSLKEAGFPYRIFVLSDDCKNVVFYTIKDCPMATGASYYRENTPFFADDKISARTIPTETLDFLWEHDVFHIEHPFLLKLDTQGSELDILKGSEKLLKEVDAIVTEMSWSDYNLGGCTGAEMATFMARHGFLAAEKLGDIIHPIEREKIIQTDMLFIKLQGYGG